MDKLKEWFQIYQEHRRDTLPVEPEDLEMAPHYYAFSLTSVPQLFTQQSVQLLLVYQKNLLKSPLSNLAEVRPQDSVVVQCTLKAQNMILLLQVVDQRSDEVVLIECRPTGSKGYRIGLRGYLLNSELDSSLADSRGDLVQFTWAETQSIQGVTLEDNQLYSQVDLDSINNSRAIMSQAPTVTIDEVKLSLNQVASSHQQSGNYALMVKQHTGMAILSSQVVNLQQNQGLTFTTPPFQFKLPDNIILATFIYLIEQGPNTNVILGYLPFDPSIQNEQMMLISQGKTILGETITTKFQGLVHIKNLQYQQQQQQQQLPKQAPLAQQSNSPISQPVFQNIDSFMRDMNMNQTIAPTPLQAFRPPDNAPVASSDTKRDQELEFLRSRVQQLEQQNMNQTYSPALQDSLNNRETQFVGHLNQLREDNRLLFSQKQEEYQKLREVIMDLKEQNSTLLAQGGLPPKDPLLSRVEQIVQVHQGRQVAESRHQILDPQYGMRDMSRKDRAQFAQGPWGYALQQESVQNIDLQQEYKDNKKQLVFTFQFMGMEKKLVELGAQNQKSILNESYCLPHRVHFSINFYDFAQFRSETYSLNSQGLLNQEGSSRQSSGQYVFRVDSSDRCVDQTAVQNNYQLICDYLFYKNVNIDIYDSDSLMIFGNAQVRLQELLRQGQEARTMMKAVDVRDTMMCRIKGALKVVVAVKAEPCGQLNYVDSTHQLQGQTLLASTANGKRRKVKSQAPLQVPTQFQGDQLDKQPNTGQSMQSRIKDKIEAYKRHSAANNMLGKGAAGEQIETREKRLRQLELIGRYREDKKQNLVREIQEQLVEEERRVEVQQGVQQIQTYRVLNGGSHDTLYRVTISDTENQHLAQPEVQLVTKAMEWRHLLSQHPELPAPMDFDLITQDGAFILKPNESVTLLIKVLSLRSTSLPQGEAPKEGKYMKERAVTVQLANREGQILGGVSLQLKCRNTIVDQVVRQYHGAEKYIDLIVYNPLITQAHRIMHLTYNKASVKYQNEDEVSIEVKTQQVGQVLCFNLLVFSDVYYSRLVNNVQVEVSSVQQVDVNLTLGQESQVQLPIFSDLPRICSLYSSHVLCLHFPAPFDKQFALTPASYTFINARVKSFSELNEQVVVHCVDSSSKELVFAWLVNVSTSLPKVTAVVNLQVDPNTKQTKTFFYMNRLPSWSMFELSCSKPDLLEVHEPQLAIESGAKGTVRVSVCPLNQDTQVFFFVTDKDKSMYDTLLVNLQVSTSNAPQ